MSVSEKGAGLSGPPLEDHYELELPWLRTGRSRSRKCEGGSPVAKRSGQVSRLTSRPILYTPRSHCYAYADVPLPPVCHPAAYLLAILRQKRSGLALRSLLDVAFTRPATLPPCVSDSDTAEKTLRTRDRVLRKTTRRVRSSHHLIATISIALRGSFPS